MEDHLSEILGIGEEGPFPSIPEVKDYCDHRACVKHDQQEGHRWGGGVKPEKFFRDNDVGRTGDGEEFCGALDESEEEDLEKGWFHIL
jgi:hypothetical protein